MSKARIIEGWGLLVLAAVVMMCQARSSEARIDPYYVLRGQQADVRPRVLFVLDTSGSMTWRAQSSNDQCELSQCEDAGGILESRISATRRAVNRTVAQTTTTTSYALMTFDQHDPPTAVPPKCADAARFVWVTWYGHFYWTEILSNGIIEGLWRLCQGDEQRPYPYLRWDDLGMLSPITANDQSGEVPASPLIGPLRTNPLHALRGVQWFPKFMGVRVQLNADTDPDHSVLEGTVGDYGSTAAERLANVWGHDFYYWPYVDGFPHYSATQVFPYALGRNTGGVVSEDSSISEAKLYAPFYLDLADNPAVASEDWGPEDEADAAEAVLDKTGTFIEGGVDAVGGTPWSSVIGSVNTAHAMTNTEGSHTSVASYLNFALQETTDGACAPTSVVLLTDGVPSPGEGGAVLYERLADLRRSLGVKTYVVGFFEHGSQVNEMACAGAGACSGSSCSTPCDDTPTLNWDTCADPEDPANGCAFEADSTDELAEVLFSIVTSDPDVELPSGPRAVINEFGVGADGEPGQGGTMQTELSASTRWPSWRGTVRRSLCDHRDDEGVLLPQCQLPEPQWQPEEERETYGPCPQSRVWDAGECLQATAWNDRRVYTSTAAGLPIPIANLDGTAGAAFITELELQGIVSGPDVSEQANDLVAFILGRDWPEGWKLPGLASSSPTLVRRVPRFRSESAPSVAIRDPHCGGRLIRSAQEGSLPPSLEEFARDAWDGEDEYQEAVLIGDDLGMLHAFQYDSGNELWGFIPRSLLGTAAEQSSLGAAAMGQPSELDEHIYGISATVNTAWVYDDRDPLPQAHLWRHLAVFGFGAGGREYVALDVSHMAPDAVQGPLEVLWSTADAAHQSTYDPLLGQTWARPALAYHVPADAPNVEPDPFLLLGSGYGDDGLDRHILRVDALSGDLLESAQVPAPGNRYDDAFGLVADPAVGSHCHSRFWAEAQESYFVDSAGRLFRWDLGRDRNHEADSGGPWNGTANPVATFPACVGSGSTCTVSSANPAEPFVFAPAVTAHDRIDDPGAPLSNVNGGEDQFLIAMISGSHRDDSLPTEGADRFHSSLYLLVDDHRSDAGGGFAIPPGSPKSSVESIGDATGYLRLSLTDISRTRTFVPYPGAAEAVDTQAFSPGARPTRSPRIVAHGVADRSGDETVAVADVEVFEISYFVHDPPTLSCDPRFYDASTDTWYPDQGASFEITLRLTADTATGFNFTTGAPPSQVSFEDSSLAHGLTLVGVTQLSSGDCGDGNCGPEPESTPLPPCDNNVDAPEPPAAGWGVPIATRYLRGFTPVEGS